MDCSPPSNIDFFFPPASSIRIDVCLLTGVANAAEVRKALVKGDPRMAGISLVKAELVIDPIQLMVAANKAALADSRQKMTTRSLSTEVLFNMSSSKNITESLQKFGIGDEDQNLVAVIFGDDANGRKKAAILALIQGQETDMAQLSNITNLQAILKAHKMKDYDLSTGVTNLQRLLISRCAAKDLIM